MSLYIPHKLHTQRTLKTNRWDRLEQRIFLIGLEAVTIDRQTYKTKVTFLKSISPDKHYRPRGSRKSAEREGKEKRKEDGYEYSNVNPNYTLRALRTQQMDMGKSRGGVGGSIWLPAFITQGERKEQREGSKNGERGISHGIDV